MSKERIVFALSTVLAVTCVACSEDGTRQRQSGSGVLQDGQILQVLTTANRGEVEQAQVALTTSASGSVRDFAQMMITEHGDALARGAELERTTGLIPSDSVDNATFAQRSAETAGRLRGTGNPSFDVAYACSQTATHQDLIDEIDGTLLPSAVTPDLRTAVQNTRAVAVAHLAVAQALGVRLRAYDAGRGITDGTCTADGTVVGGNTGPSPGATSGSGGGVL